MVYEDGFRTDEVRMTYYRNPVRVDLTGYINAAGVQSMDIDPELPDPLVEEILDMVAKQFSLNENELNRYSMDKDNVASFK